MNSYSTYYATLLSYSSAVTISAPYQLENLLDKECFPGDAGDVLFGTLPDGDRFIGFKTRWGNVFVVDKGFSNKWFLYAPEEILDVLSLGNTFDTYKEIPAEIVRVLLGSSSNVRNNFGLRLEIMIGDEK